MEILQQLQCLPTPPARDREQVTRDHTVEKQNIYEGNIEGVSKGRSKRFIWKDVDKNR